jgi:hypothetical protein
VNTLPTPEKVKPRLRLVRGFGVTLILFLAVAGISVVPVIVLQSTTRFHAAIYCERAFGRQNASKPDITEVKRVARRIGLPIFLLYLVLTVALTIMTETMDVPYLEQHGEDFILWGIIGPFVWWNWIRPSVASSASADRQDD